jgi:ligand-binding sensor domain-containing protein/signal transduction histidine kinase/DNA-binding response OmpR family regulator
LKRLNITILYAVGFLWLSLAAVAQDKEHSFYRFSHLSSRDGLPQNSVLSILQDKSGFLWFGTDDGLARYDGYTFVVYQHDPADSFSISNNVIRGLVQDNYGFIWVATEGGGINVFNPLSERFISLKQLPGAACSKISSLTKDHKGDIWAGTLSCGLIHISYQSPPGKTLGSVKNNIHIRQHEQNRQDEFALKDNKIWDVFEDKNQQVWIGTYEGGLQSYDQVSNKFTDHPILYHQKPVKSIKVYYEDSRGNIWIGTEHFGLFKKDKKRGDFIHFPFGKGVKDTGTLHPNITDILEDDQGQIWIGTLGGGVSIYDPNEEKFHHYTDHPADPYSLKGNSVFTFYEDSDNNLWIGMYSGEGLNRITPTQQYFEHYRPSTIDSLGLSGKMVKSIYRDKQERLWVGIFNGGLNQLDSSRKHFRYFFARPENPNFVNHNNVQCITEGHNGLLWIGTDGGGLHQYDPVKGTFKVYRAQPGEDKSLSKDEVWALCWDHQGYLWVGTANGGGLNRFHPGTEEFENFKHEKNNSATPSFNDIRVLFLDSKNNLWIGTFGGGLNKYDFRTGKFQYFQHDPSSPESISHNIITSIQEDHKGNLWIGTFGGGLNKFNPDTEIFTTFRKKDGLPSDVVKAILEDERGNLWISTVNGLSRFNPKLGVFKNFTVNDGLQSDEFNLGSAFKDKSGKMYFGGANGLNSFYPEKLAVEWKLEAPVITSLRVLNKQVLPGDEIAEEIILQNSISHSPKLTLTHRHNSFEFEFSALQFNGQDNIKYAYKLDGFDRDWIITGAKRRYAPYANLKAGEYVFRIKASNEHGAWEGEERVLKMTILPPWWKSTPAYIFYFILTGLAFYLIKSLISYRIKLKNDIRFERLEYQKQEELNQLKLSFFTNISHELRTPLMLINAPLEQLVKRNDLNEKVHNQLRSIHNNASRLLRLINQLLDFRKQETGNMGLAVREENVVLFVKNVFTSFEDLASQRQIEFVLTVEEDLDPILFFDAEQIEKVLYNLCHNAFKFTPDGGRIQISIFRSFMAGPDQSIQTPSLAIAVTDNGKGILAEHQVKIFDRFFQVKDENGYLSPGTGIGLALSRNLIELHKGQIEVFSIPGEKTTFTVRLRQGKDHFQKHEFAVDSEKQRTRILYKQELPYLEEKFINSLQSNDDQSLKKRKKGQKLLIVEDNQELLFLMQDSLEKFFHILTASNGREGLKVALSQKPDFIISDVMMPEIDGVEMCSRIKENIETSHIPLILLTAKTAHSSQLEGYESGADDYISKPFPLDLLVLKVQNLLQSRKRLKEKFRKVPDLEPTEISITSTDGKLMEKAMEIVERHMDNPEFDISIFVKEIGISRTLLYEKLKAITGHTPNEFIQVLRLKRAAQLLLKSELKVADICYMVGFNNPKYFSKCFRKQFDCTPSKFAEKQKSETKQEV